MKKVDYEYVPAYQAFDDRARSEKIFDIGSEMMIWLIIAAACWLGAALLLLWVTASAPVIYYPLIVIRFIGKWVTLIGWPIWLIVQVAGYYWRHKERKKALEKVKKYIGHADEEQN